MQTRPVPRTKQAWQQKYPIITPQTKMVPRVKLVENCNRGYHTNWWEE